MLKLTYSTLACGLRLSSISLQSPACCLLALPSLFLRLSSYHTALTHPQYFSENEGPAMVSRGARILARDVVVNIHRTSEPQLPGVVVVSLNADRFSTIIVRPETAASVLSALPSKVIVKAENQRNTHELAVSVSCNAANSSTPINVSIHNHSVFSLHCSIASTAWDLSSSAEWDVLQHAQSRYELRCEFCGHCSNFTSGHFHELIEREQSRNTNFDFEVCFIFWRRLNQRQS